MEAHVVFGGIGTLAAFGCGAAACSSLAGRSRRRPPISFGGSDPRSERVAWLMRNGVGCTRPVARALLRVRAVKALAHEAEHVAVDRGWTTTAEALLSLIVAVLAVVILLASVVGRTIVCGAAVAVCACVCSAMWLRAIQDKRKEAMRESVPDALRSMGVCFQSGLSLLQTFQQVASEVQEPLASLFARAAHRMEVGDGAESALDVLRRGSDVAELAFVAVALDVQHQAGGSMKQVLDAARDTVENEIGLRRSLRVQTAQAKLSARVVSALPFVLIAVFSLVSEGFLSPFFESALGLGLLALALGMQVAGIAVVRRMLAVEVE